MTTATMQLRGAVRFPEINAAHWFLRLPLALIIAQQGVNKLPLSADMAAGYGLPLALWALAAFGEIATGVGLVVGGLVRTWVGDLMTRLAGLGIAVIVAGVIVVAYWAPLLDILFYNQLQVLLLVGGLYFALRGNRA